MIKLLGLQLLIPLLVWFMLGDENDKHKKKILFDVPSPAAAHPQRNSSLGSRVVVAFILIIVIVAFGLLIQRSFVGKAIDVPVSDEHPLDLDSQESEEVNLVVDRVPLLLTLSSEQRATLLLISFQRLDNGQISYQVAKRSLRPEVVAMGFLGDGVLSTGGIFINNDEDADLELTLLESLGGDYIHITNLNYVEPEAATITRMTEQETMLPVRERESFIRATPGQQVTVYFHVNSTEVPLVRGEWLDGTVMTSEFAVVRSTRNSSLVRIQVTPPLAGAFTFDINATVDTKMSRKRFVLAVGGVEYVLLDAAGESRLQLQTVNDVLRVRFTIPASEGLQPLAAPCAGFPALSTLAADIATVYTYDARVQQWREGIPSEFQSPLLGRGYLVRLKPGRSLTVEYACQGAERNPDQQFPLPMLREGWNLIGITGNYVRDASEVELPLDTEVAALVEATASGNRVVSDLRYLEPGRVYWVKIE